MKNLYVHNVLGDDDSLTLFGSKNKYCELGETGEQFTLEKKYILDFKIYKDSQMIFSSTNQTKSNFSFGKAVLGKALLGDGGAIMGLSNNNTSSSEFKTEYTSVLIYIKYARYEKYNVSFDEVKLDLIYELRGLNGFFIPYDSVTENLNAIGSFLTFTNIDLNNRYYQEKIAELDNFEKSLESTEVTKIENTEEDLDIRLKKSKLQLEKVEPYNKILTLPYNKDFKKYNNTKKMSDFIEHDEKRFIENNSKYNNNNKSRKKKSIRGLNKYDAIVAIVEVNGEEFTCEFKDIAIRPNCEVFVYLSPKGKNLNGTVYIGVIKKLLPVNYERGSYSSWERRYSYNLTVDGFILFQTYYLQNGTKEKILEDIKKHSSGQKNLSGIALHKLMSEDSLFLLEKFDISKILSTSSYCTFEKKLTFEDYKSSLNEEITEIKNEINKIHFTFLKKNQQKKEELERKIKEIENIITNIDVSKKFSLPKLVHNNDYYYIFRKYFLNTKEDNPFEFYNNEVKGRKIYNELMKTIKDKIKDVMIDYCDFCVDSDIYPHPVDSSTRNELLFYNLDIPNYKNVKSISVKILFPQNIDEYIYEYGDCFLKPKKSVKIIHEDTIEYKLSKWLCLKLFNNDESICFESPSNTWLSFEEDGVSLSHGVNIISIIGNSIPIVLYCTPIENFSSPYEKRNISIEEYIKGINEVIHKKEKVFDNNTPRNEIIEKKLDIQQLRQLAMKLKKQIK